MKGSITKGSIELESFDVLLEKGFKVSYKNKETILFNIGPYSGNLD